MHYNISSIILYPQQWYMYTKNCQLLKVFNDVNNTLSVIYYHTTNVFIIESFNIVGAFDDQALETCNHQMHIYLHKMI